VAYLEANNRFESICNDLAVALMVITLIAEQADAHLPTQRRDLVERGGRFCGLENSRIYLAKAGKLS